MKRLAFLVIMTVVVFSMSTVAFGQPAQASGVAGMLDTVLAKVTGLVQPDTLIGKPITVEGITFIPVIKASIGFGGGGGEGPMDTGFGGGAGAGVEMQPISFLMIKDGEVTLLSATKPTSPWVDFIMEFLPMIMQGMGDMSGMLMPDPMNTDQLNELWMYEETPGGTDSLPPMGE